MNTRTIILACCLLVAIVIGMFTYTYVAKDDIATSTVELPLPEVPADPYNIDRIEAKHFYRDGVHTIVGELPMPTPCDLIETNAVVAESMPEQVTFEFTVINTTDTCAAVVTTARFMVQASASNQASLQATFMGKPVSLNLVEALDSESLEDFELYQKG